MYFPSGRRETNLPLLASIVGGAPDLLPGLTQWIMFPKQRGGSDSGDGRKKGKEEESEGGIGNGREEKRRVGMLWGSVIKLCIKNAKHLSKHYKIVRWHYYYSPCHYLSSNLHCFLPRHFNWSTVKWSIIFAFSLWPQQHHQVYTLMQCNHFPL